MLSALSSASRHQRRAILASFLARRANIAYGVALAVLPFAICLFYHFILANWLAPRARVRFVKCRRLSDRELEFPLEEIFPKVPLDGTRACPGEPLRPC